jgi:hypothetical protein
MIKKFPIPLKLNGKIYHSADIVAPSSGVLADTKKVADSGDRFNATLTFLTGCVESIISDDSEISEKIQVKSALRHMPFRTAEVLALKAILQIHSDDGIEGLYICPRCQHKVIAQVVEENGEVILDTRDFINNLDIAYMDDYSGEFEIQFTEPVVVINALTKEVLMDYKSQRPIGMNKMKMIHPTMANCIEAQAKQGGNDEMRLQYRIYVEAITELDGIPIDKQFKEKYGMMLFEKIKNINDIGDIAKKVHEFGIDRHVKKVCPNCAKEWKAVVNTSNFFESAPLAM